MDSVHLALSSDWELPHAAFVEEQGSMCEHLVGRLHLHGLGMNVLK